MSKTAVRWLSLVLAVAVVGYSGAAFAANQAPAKPSEVKATVTGKIETKTEKVANKDETIVSILVAGAKSPDGKAITTLSGKTLKLTGAKAAELASHAGAEVEVSGIVESDTSMVISGYMMQKHPASPAPPAK